MKPILLTMQAFGSYGKKTVIDFTKPNQNLFLITGDTGAGKTTIFDAIVFALYGQASSSSNKKEGIELQSQFVDCGTTPFVELCFTEEIGGQLQRYTVRRVPRHLRPLKRGTGIKEERETVSLMLPEGREYSQNQKETDAYLVQIVGLTREQFMQVAMIAQGEFMELLRTDSNKKKEIFRKLFNTELYQGIVLELDQRRKSKLTDMAQIRTACQTETAHIQVPEDWENGPLEEVRQRILSADRLSAADMELLLQLLQKLCEEQKTAVGQTKQLHKQASADRDLKRDALHRGQLLQNAFAQLEDAEKTLRECEAEEPRMQQLARRIRQIRSAFEIKAVFDRLEDARLARNKTEKKLEEQTDCLPALTKQAEEAALRERAAHQQKDQMLQSFATVSQQVEKALNILDDLKAADEAALQQQKDLDTCRKKLETSRKDLEAFRLEKQEKQRRLQTLADAKLLMNQWETQMEEVRQLLEEADSLDQLYKELADQEKKTAKARKTYQSARTEYQAVNQEYEAERSAFLDAQAGYLAREKLRPGQRCPVCGSLEHPLPCTLAEEHQELTREGIEALGRERDRLDQKQNDAAAAVQAATEVLEEKNASIARAEAKLCSRVSQPEGTDRAGIRQTIDRMKQQLQQQKPQLEQNCRELDQIQTFLRQTEQTEQALNTRMEAAAEKVTQAQTGLATQEAKQKELEKQKLYDRKEDARKALSDARAAKKTAEDAFDEAHRVLETAKTRQEQACTLIGQLREALPTQVTEQNLRETAYQSRLKTLEMTEEFWQELTASSDQTEEAVLQSRLDDHLTRKAAAAGSRETALKTVADQEKPDLDGLRAAFSQAQALLEQRQVELDRLQQQYTGNQTAYDALAPKMEERARLTRDYSRIDSLYRRLAGKETGGHMDIETYVQRCYLQRILYAANMRFMEMSAGQFELRMVSEDAAGDGRNRGLDLMVYSTVTGQEREVRTLSGGESFMAALSLALGMADQIQENSAAIHLDMMFIDEGFGSLDAHSRDQAVKVLQTMASGSKLIGIISHVSELKSAIEDQLIVKKDETGSHPHWVIS